jgi:hypothetical protein
VLLKLRRRIKTTLMEANSRDVSQTFSGIRQPCREMRQIPVRRVKQTESRVEEEVEASES